MHESDTAQRSDRSGYEALRRTDTRRAGGPSGGRLSNFKNELTGCGPFLHDDPQDRPPEIFGGTTTLHFSRAMAGYVLLPIIPPKAADKKQAKQKKKS